MIDSIALTGRLDFVSLPHVLQFISSNGATGALVLKSPHASQPGLIFFLDGMVINAYAGSQNGVDAAYALFGWTEGEFSFDLGRVEKKRVISQSLMEIVLEGVRRLDEGEVPELGPRRTESARSEASAMEPGVNYVPSPEVDYSYVVAEEVFSKGQNIVEEGNHGNWICVVLEGFADVVKQTRKGPLSLCRIGQGALIGDIAIVLKKENVRRATVIAQGEVVLGVLDLDRIHRDLALMSYELRGLLLSLNRRLSEINHNYARIHMSGAGSDMKSFNGRKAFSFGADKDAVYQITEGSAVLACPAGPGLVRIADLEPGDFVGRPPFFDLGHEPDQAVVLPSEDFMVTQIPLDDVVQEYQGSPNMIKCIAGYISNCVAATTLGVRRAAEPAANKGGGKSARK